MEPPKEQQSEHGKPVFGIIMLDTLFPRILGDIGNPKTFPFPVHYQLVKGATPARVVKEADPLLLEPFIEAARVLEQSGVKAITTSCGYLAIFHRELVRAVRVPMFTSSLLQVHAALPMIRKEEKIGIITARKDSLTVNHLKGVGIESYPLIVVGMDDADEFTAVFIEEKRTIDVEKCRREIAATAKNMIYHHPDIGAIVLECTNMSPFASDVHRVTGRPVFDAVTMIHYGYASVRKEHFNTE